jgi:hypothetical protein
MQFGRMRRREFITLLGGATAWPLAARAQQGGGMRRIGVLMNLAAGDTEGTARLAAFLRGLEALSWSQGRNIQIDYRWGAEDAQRHRKFAAELVALAPDVILASGNPSVAALQQATRSVPVVFANIIDPVASGFVESLARPGGNITGFSGFEYGTSGKWLELLKEIAPRITRAAILRDLALAHGSGQLGAIQSVAPSLGVELTPISVAVRDPRRRRAGARLRLIRGRGRSASDHDWLTRDESGNFKPRTCFANKGGSGQNPNLLSSRLLLTRAAASASDVEQRPPQLAASFNSKVTDVRYRGANRKTCARSEHYWF